MLARTGAAVTVGRSREGCQSCGRGSDIPGIQLMTYLTGVPASN